VIETNSSSFTAGLPLLAQRPIAAGERWIFSAGFNTTGLHRHRIDTELDDLTYLLDRGVSVAILSHQGRHADHTAKHLNEVAEYLSSALRRPVRYFPDAASREAEDCARALGSSEAVLFGNTRFYEGEERGDADLARRFARLGDHLVIAGFSKAHRKHASNVGLIKFVSTVCLSGSFTHELNILAGWREPSEMTAVAVIGGEKPEKLKAFAHFTRTWPVVIPTGTVLNAVLSARGCPVGSSSLGEEYSDAALSQIQRALDLARARVLLPEFVVVEGPSGRREAAVGDRVSAEERVVDLCISNEMDEALRRAARTGRLLVAGTPFAVGGGHSVSAVPLTKYARAAGNQALLLGGDTVADLAWDGPQSTGGGAAITYLTEGRLPVLDAIRAAHADLAAATAETTATQ
jgi:phosphoglycerate kinase